jgi:hypothetical protein
MIKRSLTAFFLFLSLQGFSQIGLEPFYFTAKVAQSHLKGYSPEEKLLIEKDLKVVRSVCFSEGKKKSTTPIYLATAGGPGSRKSTILERFLKEHPEYSQCIYLDPDQRCLKFMSHTYYSLSLNADSNAKEMDFSLVTKKAYEKWRGASNYIALTLLEEAFSHRYDIAHGTTSTGDHIPDFFKKLKEKKYEIVLLLVSCQDSLRRQAISYRNEEQMFYQSTPEDAMVKAKLFAGKMVDYFSHADLIYFFWSDDLFLKERLAGVMKKGTLEIKDAQAMHSFIQKYEEDRKGMRQEGKDLPSWEALLKIAQRHFLAAF